jgi:hypothetical protein
VLTPFARASCSASIFFAASQHRLYLSMSGWHLLWSMVDEESFDLLTGRREMHTWISHANRLHFCSQMSAPSRIVVFFWYTNDAGMRRRCASVYVGAREEAGRGQ